MSTFTKNIRPILNEAKHPYFSTFSRCLWNVLHAKSLLLWTAMEASTSGANQKATCLWTTTSVGPAAQYCQFVWCRKVWTKALDYWMHWISSMSRWVKTRSASLRATWGLSAGRCWDFQIKSCLIDCDKIDHSIYSLNTKKVETIFYWGLLGNLKNNFTIVFLNWFCDC